MIPKLKLVTAPANPVVSTSNVKSFLRVDGTDDDALIAIQVSAATQRLESLVDQKFINQTWDIYYDSLPHKRKDDWWDGTREGHINQMTSESRFLNLPIGPISSLTGVYTYDEDDTEYEFTSTYYTVDLIGSVGRVALKLGQVWPSTILRPVNGFKVRGVFGMGADDSAMPDDIVEAVKQFTATIYEHRGDEMPKIPATVSMLLEPYRRFKVGV